MLTEQDKKEIIALIDERILDKGRQKIAKLSKLDVLISLRNTHLQHLVVGGIDETLFFRQKVKRNTSAKERATITKMEAENQSKLENNTAVLEIIDDKIQKIKDKEVNKNATT